MNPGPAALCARSTPEPAVALIAQRPGLLTETPTPEELTAGITALLEAGAARAALDEHGLRIAAVTEQLLAAQTYEQPRDQPFDPNDNEVSVVDRPTKSDALQTRLAQLRTATDGALAANQRARRRVDAFAQLLGRGSPGGLLPTQRGELRQFGQLLAEHQSPDTRDQAGAASAPTEDLLMRARLLWSDPLLRPVARQAAILGEWSEGWQHGPLPENPVGPRDIAEIDLGTIGGVCDKGPRKSQNQDAMAAMVLATRAGPVRIGVVTDGVSQSIEPARAAVEAANAARDHLARTISAYDRHLTPEELRHTVTGAVAQAQVAVERFTEVLRSEKRAHRDAARATEACLLAIGPQRDGGSDDPITFLDRAQQEVLLDAQQRASDAERDLRLLQPGSYPPATTIGIAVVEAGDGTRPVRCTSANVGDTRVQAVGPGAAGRNLSRDHSIVPELIDRGVTEKMALLSPLAHTLTSCLQAGHDPIPHVRISELSPDETVLVDSDGIWNDTPDPAELARALSRGQTEDPLSAALRLRDIAVAGGGRDNATVLVISGRAADATAIHPDRAASAWQWAPVRVAALPPTMPAHMHDQYDTVLDAHRQAAARVYRAAAAFVWQNPSAEVSLPYMLAPELFRTQLAGLPAGVGRTEFHAAVEDYHRLAGQVTDFAAWVADLPAERCTAADRAYAAAMARFAAACDRLCQADKDFRDSSLPEGRLPSALREASRAECALAPAKASLLDGPPNAGAGHTITQVSTGMSQQQFIGSDVPASSRV